MLLDIGDDIFYADNITEMLINRLKNLIPESVIRKNANIFATLIFFEKQVNEKGGDEEAE